MKLYEIHQSVNNSYDTYDSAIVCAENEEEAKAIHPSGIDSCSLNCWCGIKDIKVDYIGEAKEGLQKGVVCASFNAG